MRFLASLTCLLALTSLVPLKAQAYSYWLVNVRISENTGGSRWREALAEYLRTISKHKFIRVTAKKKSEEELFIIDKLVIKVGFKTIFSQTGMNLSCRDEDIPALIARVKAGGVTNGFPPVLFSKNLSGAERVHQARTYLEMLKEQLGNASKEAVLDGIIGTLPTAEQSKRWSNRKIDKSVRKALLAVDEVKASLALDLDTVNAKFNRQSSELFFSVHPADERSRELLQQMKPLLYDSEFMELAEAVFEREGTIKISTDLTSIVPATKKTPVGFSKGFMKMEVEVDGKKFDAVANFEFNTSENGEKKIIAEGNWLEPATEALRGALSAAAPQGLLDEIRQKTLPEPALAKCERELLPEGSSEPTKK